MAEVTKRESVRPLRVAIVAGAALLGVVGATVAYLATRGSEADLGRFRLVEVARAATRHQRADRVAFADGGRLLAVSCPRYDRVVLYRVGADETLAPLRDIRLDGRPVALCPASDRLYILQRPSGDARHVEEGFWRAYDFDGEPVGSKFRVGFDPDDMVVTRDGRFALVLNSGHAEGETNRPDPALVCVELGGVPRVVARLPFDHPGDDPERITLSALGTHAAVKLLGSDEVAGVLVADPAHPVLTGRVPLAAEEVPYPSDSVGEAILMPVRSTREAVVIADPNVGRGHAPEVFPYVVSTLPDDSGLEVLDARDRRPLGRLALRGAANLGSIRPMGLAYSEGRRLLAVANRAGGVHLVAIRPNPALASGSVASAGGESARR